MKILFICTAGQIRSRTAAHCLKEDGVDMDYAGLSIMSSRYVLLADLEEVDHVICMEKWHVDRLKRLTDRHIVCWNIDDRYDYMDDALVHTLRSRYRRFLCENSDI